MERVNNKGLNLVLKFDDFQNVVKSPKWTCKEVSCKIYQPKEIKIHNNLKPRTSANKVSHTLQSPLEYPANSSLPDMENAIEVTWGASLSPFCWGYTWSWCPVLISNNLQVPSSEPVPNLFPSGKNFTELTSPSWPWNVRTARLATRVSQSRAVESQDPDTNILELDALIETLKELNGYSTKFKILGWELKHKNSILERYENNEFKILHEQFKTLKHKVHEKSRIFDGQLFFKNLITQYIQHKLIEETKK